MPRHTIPFLAILLGLLSSGTLAQPATEPTAQAQTTPVHHPDTDRYEIWISGSRSGWSHETVTTEGDRITTRSEMSMTIGRADQALTIRTTSSFVESLRGEPIEMTVSQSLGQVPIDSSYVFDTSEVRITTTQDGKSRETTMPLPEGNWLPPAAAARFLAQRLASGATTITSHTLDPSNGLAIVKTFRKDITPAEIEVLGTATNCFHATSTTQVGPVTIEAQEWLAKDGTVLRNETNLGGMAMTMIASTRERALERADPAEIMVSTFVKPDRRIRNARTRTRGVYEVRLSEGTMPELPTSAYQRVEPLEGGAVRVTVDMNAPVLAGETDRALYLASTTYADADDELIQELTAEALANAGDAPHARAEALRRFVFAHISDKNLGTAFATASETARSGKGDCSEHGVLLAAMLRAADIPSRVAVGVVYVDRFAGQRDVFGYHMWTQALLETDAGPAWIDIDATLDARTPFDATHIAFGVSSLEEGKAVSSLAGIAPLLGTLEIVIEEVE